MFENRWLEALTCVHPALVIAIFGPAAAYFLWKATQTLPWLHVALGVTAGLLFWTLLEYVLHRFVFHLEARLVSSQVALYLCHGVHHAFPDDHRRWVMSPLVSVPIAWGLYTLATLALGASAAAAFAGMMIGYLAYDLLHYTIHRGALRTAWGRELRRNHLLHHHAMAGSRYGVSSPLWDYVFRTRG